MAGRPRRRGGGEQRGAPKQVGTPELSGAPGERGTHEQRRAPQQGRTPGQGPPAGIRNAVTLMYVGAGISMLSLIIALATAGGLKSAIRRADPHLTAAQVNTTATSLIVGTVTTGLLGTALWLWMAWANKRGMSWARIVSSAFFGIATLETAAAVTKPSDLYTKIATVAIWVVGAGAIVGLWLPESSAYYQAASGGASAGGRSPGPPGKARS